MLKDCVKVLLGLIMGIAGGTGLLCIVFLIPVDSIQEHVRESMAMILEEGENPFLIEGYKGSSLDNYTDCLMLANASYASEQPFYKASMLVERADNEQDQPLESLRDYLVSSEEKATRAYGRYWHGYLVVLKPLLAFMNYEQIRILNGIVCFCVLSGTILGFVRRRMWRGLVAFLLAILSLFPMTIPYSLQFSSVFYIGILACLLILWRFEWLEKRQGFIGLFFAVGMITSYMDFLTYPLFTLGMPLVVFCVLERCTNMRKILYILQNSIVWGIGYAGMWCGKWLVGSLLTRRNLLLDAMGTVTVRLSHEAYDEKINALLSIGRNGYIYFNLIGILLFAFLCIWILSGICRYKKNIHGSLLSLIITAFMPFVWYCILMNHSYMHYWYTFRSLSVTVFAIGMIPEMLYLKIKG